MGSSPSFPDDPRTTDANSRSASSEPVEGEEIVPDPAEQADTPEDTSTPVEIPEAAAPAPAARDTQEPDDADKAHLGRAEALAKLTTDADNGVAAPEAPAEEAPVEETPAEEVPADAAPTDDASDEALREEMKDAKAATRKRFDDILSERKALKGKVEELAPAAQFGMRMAEHCRQAGISPEQFQNWTGLGTAFVQGDPRVIPILKGMLADAEAKDAKANPPKPMPDWLTAKVTSMDMTKEAADEIWSNLQKQEREARFAQPPPQKQPAQQAAPQQQPPQTEQVDPRIQTMRTGLNTIETGIQTKYKTEAPKIIGLVMAKVQAQGQAAPEVIVERAKRALADVEAEIVSKKKVVVPTTRPSARTVSGASAKTGRAAALALLTR